MRLDRPFGNLRTNARRWRSAKHSLDAEVFIHVRPMKTHTRANDLPISSLLRTRVCEAWIPDNGDREFASVGQRDDQFVVCDLKPDGQRLTCSFQGAHSISPNIDLRCRAQYRGSRSARARRIHVMRTKRRAEARTWRCSYPAQHGHAEVHPGRGYRRRCDMDPGIRSSAPVYSTTDHSAAGWWWFGQSNVRDDARTTAQRAADGRRGRSRGYAPAR
jgi:hypothetical protein